MCADKEDFHKCPQGTHVCRQRGLSQMPTGHTCVQTKRTFTNAHRAHMCADKEDFHKYPQGTHVCRQRGLSQMPTGHTCVKTKRILTLYSIDAHYDTSTTDRFRKHCGKTRNCNEQFILFPQCFLLIQIILSPFLHILTSYLYLLLKLKSLKLAYQVKG